MAKMNWKRAKAENRMIREQQRVVPEGGSASSGSDPWRIVDRRDRKPKPPVQQQMFRCSICNTQMNTREYLLHRRVAHAPRLGASEPTDPVIDGTRKMVPCDRCGVIVRQERLAKHLRLVHRIAMPGRSGSKSTARSGPVPPVRQSPPTQADKDWQDKKAALDELTSKAKVLLLGGLLDEPGDAKPLEELFVILRQRQAVLRALQGMGDMKYKKLKAKLRSK